MSLGHNRAGEVREVSTAVRRQQPFGLRHYGQRPIRSGSGAPEIKALPKKKVVQNGTRGPF